MCEKKTIGILGGMGPLATADLFQKITLLTEAETDRDHIRVYIDSNANIPDRTAPSSTAARIRYRKWQVPSGIWKPAVQTVSSCPATPPITSCPGFRP